MELFDIFADEFNFASDCPEFWHFNEATNACELSKQLFNIQCHEGKWLKLQKNNKNK